MVFRRRGHSRASFFCPIHRSAFRDIEEFREHKLWCPYFKTKRATNKIKNSIEYLNEKQKRLWD